MTAIQPEKIGLVASSFTPMELRDQAVQAIAALMLHHRLTLNAILTTDSLDDHDLKSLLEWHEDYLTLRQAGNMVGTIRTGYDPPPKDVIARAVEKMKADGK